MKITKQMRGTNGEIFEITVEKPPGAHPDSPRALMAVLSHARDYYGPCLTPKPMGSWERTDEYSARWKRDVDAVAIKNGFPGRWLSVAEVYKLMDEGLGATAHNHRN
jgi:hypothetical protein